MHSKSFFCFDLPRRRNTNTEQLKYEIPTDYAGHIDIQVIQQKTVCMISMLYYHDCVHKR